jgi:hypothetical protein
MIPKNIDFFRMAFPKYKLLEDGADKINSRIGVLDQLCYNDSLEGVVRGELPLKSIDSAGKEEINRALHSFKIHTCDPEMKNDLSNPAVTEGIKIFQKEYMEKQNPVEKYDTPGALCKNTIASMNKALFEEWKRKLYFYYNFSGKKYKEYYLRYINDEDIQVNIDDSTKIYAQETGGAEMRMGTRETYSDRYHGIRRYATLPYYYDPGENASSVEKVCSAIAKSEGNKDGEPGGFDTINEYDAACLSVGLFHWNKDGLWNLLDKLRTDSGADFDTLIKQHGLDIKRGRIFIIDGTDYPSGNIEELRRLKFVYRFIKAADNVQFQNAQIAYSQEWLKNVIGFSAGTGEGTVKQYITSQYGIALVLDFSVRIGDSSVTISGAVNTAIQNVLNSLDSRDKARFTIDKPEDWNDDMEIKIINAFNVVRKGRMKKDQDEANRREANIEKANLSKKRGSFDERR